MSINKGSTSIGAVYYGNIEISDIYKGSQLVYESFKPQTIRFDYTGDVQTWTVPKGCKKLIVDCVGAAGGSLSSNGSPLVSGGLGGRVNCKLQVTAGQTLYFFVGGVGGSYDFYQGGSAVGGYNGGFRGNINETRSGEMSSGGGGSSDIRIGGQNLNNRVIVAGAGGGSSCGLFSPEASPGGSGGGLIGGNGKNSGGGGGTQSSGGGAGYTYGNITVTAGSLGFGGQYSGGAGYYGGGGCNGAVGGGGGGSSYTDPTLCSNVTHTQGYSEASGNGWIIITTSR